MKIGDLVRATWASRALGPGLVVDKLGTVVKVMFSDQPGKAITFVETHLEVVNESR
jgi:hypothetical protein